MCKILLSILAFFLPPLAMLFHGGCDCNLVINFLLTCLAWLPGVIHAYYILWCTEPPQTHTHTTVYIQGEPSYNQGQPAYSAPPPYDP